MQVEAIAYHGWGYDHTCWNGWKATFTSHDISFAASDRGYFGTPSMPHFSDGVMKLLLVHSYGLHLCPAEQLQAADVLVVFSSFLTFHPEEERTKRRSQRVLQRMINEFETNSTDVLVAFRTNSDDPSLDVPNDLNHPLLMQDLKHLDTAQLDPQVLNTIPKIVVLHGTGDRIVPLSQGQDLRSQLAAHADYVELTEAGHALPFTHHQACWTVLKERLSFLREAS